MDKNEKLVKDVEKVKEPFKMGFRVRILAGKRVGKPI
jgi:hypothetical protein